MTFQEFVQLVDHEFHSATYKQQLMYGQYVMNILHDVWHTKYLEISDSHMDCRNVAILLNKLEKEWDQLNVGPRTIELKEIN